MRPTMCSTKCSIMHTAMYTAMCSTAFPTMRSDMYSIMCATVYTIVRSDAQQPIDMPFEHNTSDVKLKQRNVNYQYHSFVLTRIQHRISITRAVSSGKHGSTTFSA